MTTKAEQALQEKEEGNRLYKETEYEQALAAYGRAIELDPESETAALCYSNRSAAFHIMRKYAKAEKDAAACLAIKPDFVRGYVRLSVAQRKQGKWDEAVKTLTDGLKVAPDDENLKKALENCKKKLKKGTAKAAVDAAEMQRRLASVQRELGQLDDKQNLLRGRLAETTMQLRGLERGSKRSEITLKELSELPETTNTYRSVGRMYLQSPMSASKQFLADKVEAAASKIAQLQKKENYLTEAVKDVEKDIEAVVKSVQPPQ